jgi:hypothetical protein
VQEILLIELDAKEEDDFARIKDFSARIQEIDLESSLMLEKSEDGRFSRFCFTLNATRLTVLHL